MKFLNLILDSIFPKRPIYIHSDPDPLCVPGRHFRQAAYMSRLWRQS